MSSPSSRVGTTLEVLMGLRKENKNLQLPTREIHTHHRQLINMVCLHEDTKTRLGLLRGEARHNGMCDWMLAGENKIKRVPLLVLNDEL